MAQSQIRDRTPPGRSRSLWLVLPLVVAAGAGAGWMMVTRSQPAGEPRLATVPAVTPAASPAPAAAPATPSPVPRIDIARIGPDGNAVISGRATPGATVTILDGNRPIGTAQANARGEFVFLPDQPLPVGALNLRLRQTGPDGTPVDGPDALALMVPPRATGAEQSALALLPLRDGAPRMPQAADQNAPPHLMVPWRREAQPAMSRPFTPGSRVMVQPGDSLWLLARQIYGEGIRYTVIHAANQSQIRDPNLIYPGQVFSMPATTAIGSAGAPTDSSSTSSSSSRSR